MSDTGTDWGHHLGTRILLVLVLAASSSLAAKRPVPPACSGGAFVVDADAPLIGDKNTRSVASDLVGIAATVPAAPRIAIASGCPAADATVRATRRGTKVAARWPAGACTGVKGRVRFRAVVTPECDDLRGVVAAGGRKRRFSGRRHGGAVVPVTDDAHAATALVTTGGGSVKATAADGTVYTLDVPPGALADDQSITMTPLASLGDPPLAVALAAGVRFAPEGLQFHLPALLTVDLPGPVATAMVGFGAGSDGSRFHLDLATVQGARLTLPITHFSVVGLLTFAAIAVTAETALGALVLGGFTAGDPEVQGLDALVALVGQGATDPAAYVEVLTTWYTASSFSLHVEQQGVRRALAYFAPANDEDLKYALRAFLVWKQAIAAVSSATGIDVQSSLAGSIAEAEELAAAAIAVAIGRANAACLESQSLADADDTLRWQAVAQTLGLATAENELDLPTVLAGLCVHVDLTETTLPGDPGSLPAGIPAMLTVGASRRFGDGTLTPSADIGVTVTGAGFTGSVAGGHTDASGSFTTSVTPSGSGTLALLVRACIDDGAHPRLTAVCDVQNLVGSSTTTTTTTPGSTTTSTMTGGAVRAVNRSYELYAQSGTMNADVDQSASCCVDFTTTAFDPVAVAYNWAEPGYTGTATATMQLSSTVVIDPVAGVQSVTAIIDGEGAYDVTVPAPPNCTPTSQMHANAETKPASPFVFRFQVFAPVSYQLIATATVANTGGRGNATARVSLNDGLNTLYQLRDSTEQGRAETGSFTGLLLQPGTRQLVVSAALLTAPGADTSEECISQSGTTTTHVEAYLSFSPAP